MRKQSKPEPDELNKRVEDIFKALAIRNEPILKALPDGEAQQALEVSECSICKLIFDAPIVVLGGIRMFEQKHCSLCLKQLNEEAALRLRTSRHVIRADEWLKICPPKYRKFSIEEAVKRLGREVVAKVLEWSQEEKGFCLSGKTDAGKTTLIFEKMRQIHMQGIRVAIINAIDFGRELGARMSEDVAGANRWVKGLCSAPWLFIDDLGKERATDTVIKELYRIFEHRSSHLLPIALSMNIDEERLASRFTQDGETADENALPIIRRLLDIVEVIPV